MSFGFHCFDQNSNKNIAKISVLNVFVASWGLPGSFLGLPGDLVSNKVEIILEQREVGFLSPSKICENLNFSREIQIF